jgi:hypothetical protein
MMTNVRIFANQLFFLFWILVAVGNVLVENRQEAREVPAGKIVPQPAIAPALGFPRRCSKPTILLKGQDR